MHGERLAKNAPITIRHNGFVGRLIRGWVDFENGSTIGYVAGRKRGVSGSLRYDDEGAEWARGHTDEVADALRAAGAMRW